MPALMNLPVYRGDTVAFSVRLWADRYKRTPFDLTGASATGQIRSDPDSPVLATFTCAVVGTNELSVSLSKTDSAALPTGTHRYDVEVTTAAGDVSTVLAGEVEVTADITRGAA